MLSASHATLLVAMLIGMAGATSQASLCPSRTVLTSECSSVCPGYELCVRFRASYSAAVDRSSFSDSFTVDANDCVVRCMVTVVDPVSRILKVDVTGYGVGVSESQRDGSKAVDVAALTLPGNITGLQIAAVGNESLVFGYPDGNIVANGTQLAFLGLDRILSWNLPKAVHQLAITTLKLKSDEGTFPAAATGFSTISTLILDGSSLTTFPSLDVLRDLPQVRSLSLTGNQISRITLNSTTSEVVSRSSLQVLGLGENQLSAFDMKLAELEVLDLHGNELMTLPGSLEAMPKLQELRMDHNPLDNDALVDQLSTLEPFSMLQTLNLTDCGLEDKTLQAMARVFTNLTYLDLVGNDLTQVQTDHLPTKSLLHLNLSSNAISSFNASFERLQTLDVSHNAIAGFQSAFAFPSSLQFLDASSNRLQALPASLPKSLVALNASLNELAAFSASTLPDLRMLDLSHNKLAQFPGSVVWHASDLWVLRLDGNPDMAPFNITTEQFHILEGLRDFSIDASVVGGVNCPSESIKTAHGVSICVLPATSSSDGSKGTTDSTVVALNASGSSRQGAVITTIVLIVAAVLFGVGAYWHSRWRQQKAIDSHTQPAQSEPHRSARSKSLNGRRRGSRSRDVDPLVNIWNDSLLLKLRVEMETVRFVKVIGSGAYGQVWRGVCRAPTIHSSHVAIKTLSSEMARDRRAVKRFVGEIKLQATLVHPRIVEIIGVTWTSLSDLCVLMEFMPRGDLFSALHYSPASSDSSSSSMFQLGVWGESKLQITLDIVDALEFAHAMSPAFIHHNIKSANVLLDMHGRAKVADFSVARVSSVKNPALVGSTSPWWIAPEVILGKADNDEKVDIYSFGVIMSELDSHEAPYAAEVIDMTVALLRSTDVPLPDQGRAKQPSSRDKTNKIKEAARRRVLHRIATGGLRPQFSSSCPRVIHDIAQRCLAVEPSMRPSAMELNYLLRRVEMDGNDVRVSALV